MAVTPPSMGITTWRDGLRFLKRQIPDVFTKGKFNFITIHYFYIIGLAMILSIIIFAIGGIAYIDALFFASGACTQSGLNTVDVNNIHTGQQICFYIAAMVTNPIVIHGSVVFVRLYWFEKRFEDVVKDARNLRRTKSRAKTFSRDEDIEAGQLEGVRNRAIKVIRNTGRRFTNRNMDQSEQIHPPPEIEVEKQSSAESLSQPSPGVSNPSHHEPSRHNSAVETVDDFRSKLPGQMNAEHHIMFLENQRNPKDTTTLYIPSPREFDRGGGIANIDETLEEELSRKSTEPPKHARPEDPDEEILQEPRKRIGTHLTFNEPQIPREQPRDPNLPQFNTKPLRTNNSRMTTGSKPGRSFTLGKRSYTLGSRTQTLEPMPYLSYEATVTRNSFFVNLTEEQREELGGIEYRALKTLALILLGYFFGFHIFGIVCLLPWILHSQTYGAVVNADGVGRAWWGIFTAQSAFNDLGYTLTPDSMVSFQTSTWPLLVMTFLVIIGNTGFPCMLRFMIWFISKFTTTSSGLWEELHFLLDHPRRCFTLLFPRAATWWLFAILVILNGLDLFFFVVLDLNDPTVTVLPGWFKFLDGLFQAASTRTAGFSVVNLADLHPAIQVSYLIMMYISVFPIAISMRRTNVYEEKSLGIYAGLEDQEEDGKEPSYVGAHLRKQLSFDLWYIFLGLFIIAIVEGDRLQNTNEYAFTLFSVLFEIVSAYGTVGLSLGYPTINASFSAEFKVISKLVIIAMQIRGRHRGLPYELDRAVLLPSESLHEKENREAHRMLSRRGSRAMSTTSAVEGIFDAPRFRKETGLSSGLEAGEPGLVHFSPRDRRGTDRSQNTAQSAAESHHSGGKVRRGMGHLMFNVSSATNKLKEETRSAS